jgi:Rv0078B-related antitoxin
VQGYNGTMLPPLDTITRARQMFELYEAAKEMMRQNLRRRHPEAGEEEIRQRLQDWLHHRPGDVSGPVRLRKPPE